MTTTKHTDRALAATALDRLRRRPRRFTLSNGQTVEFPKAAVDGLVDLLEALASGETAMVVRTPQEVTTQQAADLLNVSRTTVVRLIEAGELPARKAGTHRRIPLGDLLAYRDEMIARRRKALDDMVADAEALGLYG